VWHLAGWFMTSVAGGAPRDHCPNRAERAAIGCQPSREPSSGSNARCPRRSVQQVARSTQGEAVGTQASRYVEHSMRRPRIPTARRLAT